VVPYTRPYDGVDAPGLRDYRPATVIPLRQRFTRRPGNGPGWGWWAVLFAIAGLSICAIGLYADAPCVTLTVRPVIMLTRADIQLSARIAHHPDHRAYALAWTSDVGVGGRQIRQLDEGSSLLQAQVFHDMPPANYTFVATIYGPGGQLLGADHAEIHTPEVTGPAHTGEKTP
jgi:hypothetical protein